MCYCTWIRWILVGLLGVHSIGCEPHEVRDRPTFRLAVSTSTRDSGLLDELIPIFEEQDNARVDVIAVGTGAALKLGEAGDVDVVLVHARHAEDAFMAAGHGVRREDVMYNSFVILGPPDDPAHITNLEPSEALRQIADRNQTFVSRGDNSGTHQREIKLWEAKGGKPGWGSYIDGGQGMGPTLIMADQLRAYVLSDYGTFLKLREQVHLVPLVNGFKSLRNPYSALVVDPKKHSGINAQLAQAFVDFLISPETQQRIEQFRIDGERLFRPMQLDPN